MQALGGTRIIKNDSVEARQNLDGSGQDQDGLQHSVTTLICREESIGGRVEGEYKRIKGLRASSIQIRVVVWTGENDTETISVDANHFEKRNKTIPFSFENGVVWDGV